jgi:uncharacterized lipoprotein YmbA
MNRRTQRACLAVVALSSACSFLKARPDPTRYFVLTSDEHKRPGPPAPIVLGVDRVELPDYLLRPEMVSRSQANQLVIADYDRWGEALKDGFSRTLRRDLENRLGAGHVLAAPFDPASRPSLVVDVDVHRFERVDGGGAELEASWTLRDGKCGAALVTRDSRERQAVARNDARASVAALSRALAQMAGQIADAAAAHTVTGRCPSAGALRPESTPAALGSHSRGSR